MAHKNNFEKMMANFQTLNFFFQAYNIEQQDSQQNSKKYKIKDFLFFLESEICLWPKQLGTEFEKLCSNRKCIL